MKKTTISIDNDLWMRLSQMRIQLSHNEKFTNSQVIRKLIEYYERTHTKSSITLDGKNVEEVDNSTASPIFSTDNLSSSTSAIKIRRKK